MSVRQGVNTIAGSGYTKSEVNTLLAGKANTATTLAGYGITDGANTNLSNITATGKEVCANMAMPSNRWVDVTLGASGATYTAPADGYFVLTKSTSANGQFIQLGSGAWSGPSIFSWSGSQYNACHAFLPARKGQVITVDYTAGGSGTFRFYYANGAQ